MNNLQKLTELLCSEEDIRKDIMTLKFWTKVEFVHWLPVSSLVIWVNTDDSASVRMTMNWIVKSQEIPIRYIEIIWNDLEERHLRMYCSSKWWNCDVQSNNLVYIWKSELWEDDKSIEEWELLYYNSSLSLNQQSEKTLEAIYNFLIK